MMHDPRRILTAAGAAVLVTATLAGCGTSSNGGSGSAAPDGDAVVVNNCGVETRIPGNPSKVVSLGVTGLAYIVAAGGEENTIGRANEFGEEPAAWSGGRADSIPLITEDTLSLEGLLALSPDLVYGGGFGSESLTPEDVAGKGIPAVVDAPECHYFFPGQSADESFETILGEVTQLGKILGTSQTADKNVADMKEKINQVSEANPGRGRKVSYAYYFGEDEGLFSYGEEGIMDEVNKTLGLTTAVDPSYHPHQGPIAPEAFVKSDPDIIIVLTGMGGATKESTLERLQKIPGYADMKAVQGNQIFYAESSMAYASPSAIHGMLELADQIK